MRRFVSDFLLPIVRGGAAHVGRPLGIDAVARMLRELPLAEGPRWPKLAACRVGERASRVSPVVAPPPFDETSLRLGAALHDLLALGHPELGGTRSRRTDRVAAAALELAAIGPPALGARGGEPALVAGAAARDRARRSDRAFLAGAADVRGAQAAARG